MAIGAITITGPRSVVVDFSVPYYETGVGFMAHIPRSLSKWAALLRPYKVNVWIPVMVTLAVSGLIVRLIFKLHVTNKRPLSLRKCYETIFKILVLQGDLIFATNLSL